MNRKRESKGIPTGGRFATENRSEVDVDLGSVSDDEVEFARETLGDSATDDEVYDLALERSRVAREETAQYVGTDGAGVPLLVGDTLLRTGANKWKSTNWRVVGSKGGKVTVESPETGKQMSIDTAKYSIVRPDGRGEDRVGYTSWYTTVEAAEEARDAWADRDPAYAKRIQDSIDDYPMSLVGSMYRTKMEALDPAVRMEVARSNYALYFSLTNNLNGWSHDDALAATLGHDELRGSALPEEDYRSMDPAELRRHALTWTIRNQPHVTQMIEEIAAERGVNITPEHRRES